jgi:molybdopterin synthase sulfur carrier subunit
VKLTLKYFASLRETLGAGGSIDWTPEAAPTAAALRAWLRTQSDAHAQALAPGRAVRVAVDQSLVDDTATLRDGAEVAFFPPVTGG